MSVFGLDFAVSSRNISKTKVSKAVLLPFQLYKIKQYNTRFVTTATFSIGIYFVFNPLNMRLRRRIKPNLLR